jgi:hypothetical protein
MLRWALFTIWFSTTAALGAQFLRLHLIPLPAPSAAIHQPETPATNGWQLTHILALHCPCSQRIADHLITRGPLPNTLEQVWLLSPNPDLARSLTTRGFTVSQVDPDRLAATTGIQGGPWLLIHNPSGTLVYSGGYAPRPLNNPAEAMDLQLLAAAQNGQSPTPFPSFGCAASHDLQKSLDPLGLKY